MSKIIGWEYFAVVSPNFYTGVLSRDPITPSGWAIRRVKGETFNLYWVGDVFNRDIENLAIPFNDSPLSLEEAKELAERLEVARCEHE